MKILKRLLLCTFVISHFTYADELKITANETIHMSNTNVHKFVGNVQINFSVNDQPKTKSDIVSMVDGKTIMEGDVEITLEHITAVTNRVVYVKTPTGLVAKMDKVTITYH